MIRGQSYDDVILISNAEERIEECAQRSIETKYLIVELSGIRSITVTDRVGSL